MGDGIGIFEAPYTAAGALGQVNLIYRGSARPCDGAYWYISSAFYDASLKEVYVTGERTDFNTNTVFKELWLLRSPDIGTTQDGLNFTQSLVVRSGLANLNLHGLYVKPHPTTPKLWWGYLFYDNTSDEVWHATAQVYVDWNNNTVRYRTSATGWTTVPIGGTMAVMPYRALTRPVVSFSNVGGRWEAWASGNDQTELPARNGVPPCAPPLTLYNQNVSGPFAQDGSTRSPGGNDLRYYTADADLSLLNSRAIYSQLRPVPSDYQFELVNAKRIDTLAGHVLYSGSLRGRSVLTISSTIPSSGQARGSGPGKCETSKRDLSRQGRSTTEGCAALVWRDKPEDDAQRVPAAGAETADAVAEVDPVGSPGALREGEIAIQSWCRQLKSLSPYCSRSGVGRVWPASWQRSRYSA